MAKNVDVFVSYTHVDAAPARALADALTTRGVQVRLGKQDIADCTGITRGINQELTRAKALVAYYSTSYRTRRACQWELAAALVAARQDGDPRQRILIVNPESSSSHIHPLELRDGVYQAPPMTGDQERLADLADWIAQHVAGLTTPLGEIGPLAGPHWVPEHRIGSARFVGRLPELWQIHSALQTGGMSPTAASGQVMVQVRGLQGVGKSLLAEEYALRFGAAYPGGVVWLRAFGHDNSVSSSGAGLLGGQLKGQVRTAKWQTAVDDELRAIAVALNLPLEGSVPDRLRAQLAAVIEASGKPWLWVVDDVPDGLDEEQLNGLLPPHPLAAVLLTSRSGQHEAVTRSLDLGTLPKTDGYTLLTSRRSPRGKAEEQAARKLEAEVGGHTLTLDVAAAALAAEDGSANVAGFRKSGSYMPQALVAELEEMLPGGYSASIARTLLDSVDQLSEEGADLLRLAAELATAPMSARLLAEVFAIVDQLEGPAAVRRAATAVQQIRVKSLARAVDERADGFEVHPLVAHTARFADPMPMRRDALRAAAGGVLANAMEVADPMDAQERPVLAEAITHARGLLSRQRDPVSQAEIQLLGAVARFDYAHGRHLTAASLFHQQWSTAHRVLGEEHRTTLAAMDNLMGTLHAMEGRIGGRDLYEQVLATRRRTLGEDHPATLAALNILAETLHALGELERARQLYEHAFATWRRTLGNDHPVTLDSMSNVALMQQATGKVTEARELHVQVLAARRRTLGQDHPDTLAAMNNLAGVLHAVGELDKARELYEQVLAARRRTLGQDHPDALAAMSGLGLVLQAVGELAEARELHQQVVTACRRVFGEEHPATLTAMNNLAGVLHAVGELDKARELYVQVVAVCRQVLGEKHPDTVTATGNLGLALHDLGELAEARELHEQVLAARRRTLGEDHPDTTDATSHLALVHHDLGELGQARELHEQVLAARRRTLGEDHPATLTAMSNLALVHHDLGELGQARELHEQVLAACRRVVGEDHPDTLTVMNNFARTLHDLGELADARNLQEQTLAACQRVLGPEHPDTLDSMTNLAATLDAQGHPWKAHNLRARAERSARRSRSQMQS